MINLKDSKWLLLPACLFVGLALLITFVSISQNYLSDYLIRNSKDHLGQKIDPEKLSQLLKDPEFKLSTPSVLVFWSVTCSPCLQKLANKQDLGPDDRRWIPINTDPENMIDVAQKVFSQYRPNEKFYRDVNSTLVTELETDYLPTNVYLSAEGIIEKIEIGEK